MKINSPNGYFNTCGRKVKAYRQKAGLSQAALALKLQLDNVTLEQKAISRIERGERIVTDFELIALAKVLCVDIKQLIE